MLLSSSLTLKEVFVIRDNGYNPITLSGSHEVYLLGESLGMKFFTSFSKLVANCHEGI